MPLPSGHTRVGSHHMTLRSVHLQKSHADELEAERERGLKAVKEAAKAEREQAQVNCSWK